MNIKDLLAQADELCAKAADLRTEADALAKLDEPTAEDEQAFVAKTDEAEALEDQASGLRDRADKMKANQAALAKAKRSTRKADDEVPFLDAPARAGFEDDPRAGFEHVGEFAAAVRSAHTPGGARDGRLDFLAAASGMSQGVNTDGGFAVPRAFSTTIWDGLNEAPDNLLGRTDQYTVEGESLTIPANAETSRATGSRYGGVRGYWIAEADQITSSKPTLRQMKLEPKELAVLVYATDKLLRNASALEQYLTRAARDEINFLVGDSIINGDGAGKPLGILNAGCLVSVAKETGQAADTVVKENIDKMFARLHSRSMGNAVWLVNQDVYPQLLDLKHTIGTGGVPVFLPPGGISGSPYGTLYNRPIVVTEYNSTVGDLGDIVLADLGAYATGLQGGIREAMSMHLRFDYAETAFRFMFAVDGQPWLASAITPFKGSNTVSPFVALAARA